MKNNKQTNKKLSLKNEDTTQSTLLKEFQNSKACKELEKELERLKKSEKQLIDNENKYRSLTENLNVGVYRNTPGARGKFIEVNPALLKIFGYKNKKIILEKNVSDLYKNRKERKIISDALKKNGFLKNEHVNLVKKDGTSIICSISATSVKDANGKVIHYDGIIVDITNQLTAESALKASEEKYYKLFENSRDAVMTLNPPSWKFTSGNKSILEMFNIKDVKKFTSLGPWDLSPSKQPDGQLSAEKAKEMIEIAVKKGSNYFHWTHKQYNGKSFPATVLLTKIEIKNEIFLQATVRDISEQKRSKEINKSLYEISNAINTTNNLGDLYKSIYRSLGVVIDVTNFFIALVDINRKTLHFPFFVDTTDDDFKPITNFNTNDSLTGMVVSKRKPILLKKKILDTRAAKNGIWGPTPVIWLGVPLVIKEEVIGVIAVQSYSDPNLYNVQDLKMLSAVSDQVAIAIDRKRTEDAVKMSEKKYRDLFEKSDDAVLIIKNDMFVDCNYATIKMLHYKSKKEFLNTHPSELSPKLQPDGKLSFKKADEMMAIALKNGSHRFEWDHIRSDGEVFPVEVLLTAISTDKDNKIIHTVWRDITERKNMQNALEVSEEKIRTTVENINDIIIYKMDEKGVYSYVSSAVANVLGYLPKEMEGTSALSYFKIKDISLIREKMAARIAGDSTPSELEMVAKNGSLIPMEFTSSPIRDKDGTVIGFSGVARDMSERKEAEQALRESEEWFSTITEQSLDGVSVATPSGDYVYVNSTFCTMMGYTQEELLKMTVFDMKKDKGENGKTGFEKSKLEKSGTIFEVELQRKNKSTFISEVTGKTIVIGDMELVLGIIKDITDRKKAEEEVKRFSQIFGNSLNEIYLFDIDTLKFTQVNRAARKNLGYTYREIRDLTPLDIKPEISSESFAKLVAPLKTGKKNKIVFETVHQRKDKTQYNVEVHLQIMKYEHDTSFVAIIIDITEHKKREIAIQTNATQRGKLLEIARELGSSLELKYILDIVTNRMLELLESKGSAIYLLDDKKEILKPVAANDDSFRESTLKHEVKVKSSLSGKVVKAKNAMIFNNAPNNSSAYHIPGTSNNEDEHLMVIPLINENEVFGTLNLYREKIIYTIDDIDLAEMFALHASTAIQNAMANQELVRALNDRQKAIKSFKASEKRFERLFNDLGDAVYVTELGGKNRGKILEVNRAAERQTGYSRNELLKMNIVKDLYISGTGEIKSDDWEENIKNGEIVNTSEKKRHKDGSEYWTDVIVTAIEYDGQVVTLSINHDTTKRKEADAKLKSRNSELEIFNEVTVGRELKMIELKEEINKMLESSGKEPKYQIIK
jgi:PAS domain S-box-containing protein